MRPEWLLDANLIALFLIGSIDRRAIGSGRHRRFDNFEPADFDALEAFLATVGERGETVVVSPNVWTEVSNLFQKDQDYEGSRWSRMLPILRELIGRFEERHVASVVAADRREFRFLGLSDVVLLELAAGGARIVTDDWELCAKAGDAGVDTLHLQLLRAAWDSAT